jgi:diadenylate cyclase
MLPNGDSEGKLFHLLQRLAFGTEFRLGLEHLLQGNDGALIVVRDDDGTVDPVCQNGFALNTSYSRQKLAELAKMDGAVVVDSSLHTIRSANVHLVPDGVTPTSETGMRHRTAERVARSTLACVITVSRRRNIITLFVGDKKYTMSHLHTLLTYSEHGLNMAESYTTCLRNAYDSFPKESPNMKDPTISNTLITVIQLQEKLRRKINNLHYYVAELGREGDIFKCRLGDITETARVIFSGLENTYQTVLNCKDSLAGEHRASRIAALSDDELMDRDILARVLQMDVNSNIDSF